MGSLLVEGKWGQNSTEKLGHNALSLENSIYLIKNSEAETSLQIYPELRQRAQNLIFSHPVVAGCVFPSKGYILEQNRSLPLR